MSAYVQIIRRDGTSERFPITGSEVILGRSANVSISLPKEGELDLEHLLILPRGNKGCWVSAAERTATPVTVQGKAFQSGVVRWGTDFKIGSLTVRLQNEETGSRQLPTIHPALWLSIVAALGFFAWSYTQKPKTSQLESGRSREHPDLFAVVPTCPEQGDALGNGVRAEHVAVSRGDRYAFDPQDGVGAVVSYGEAAGCYEKAGRPRDAELMRVEAQRFRERVEADYAAARLNLANAIEQKQWADALRETKRLELFTAHLKGGDYVEWLQRVHRQMSARTSRAR